MLYRLSYEINASYFKKRGKDSGWGREKTREPNFFSNENLVRPPQRVSWENNFRNALLSLHFSGCNCLTWRFRIKKAGELCSDEPPFGVPCPASDEKSDEIWPKSDLF
ncbi:MAG TPA: hypothetical protein PK858_06955 [Saprospiraceae bacterium]|nr:hypothetical protein [Saprospiraceae bacterium]